MATSSTSARLRPTSPRPHPAIRRVRPASPRTRWPSNFTTFLQLLTTQLKNQNPLDPLDTNQFTQQLVQFAQVEQQLKSNDQLSTLVALQKTAQATQALGFRRSDRRDRRKDHRTRTATTGLELPGRPSPPPPPSTSRTRPARRFIPARSRSMRARRISSGTAATMAASCSPRATTRCRSPRKDATGQTSAVSTEIQGIVDSVDMTQNPPLLSIGGKNYTLDKIKRVVWGDEPAKRDRRRLISQPWRAPRT